MQNAHLTWELRFRLGIQVVPSDAQGKRCLCNEVLQGPLVDHHVHRCDQLSGCRTARHDDTNGVLCEVGRCAGVAASVEPTLRAMQLLPGRRRHRQARDGARGDALLGMPEGQLVVDVQYVHAPLQTYLQGSEATGSSAAVDGAAAHYAEGKKLDKYRDDVDGGAYDFEPFVVESGGRLGKRAMGVINRLASVAAESEGVQKRVFVMRALQAVSVARVRGNGWSWKTAMQVLARGAGRAFTAGLEQPTDDVG